MKRDEMGFRLMRIEKVIKQIEERRQKRKLAIENTLIVLCLILIAVITSKLSMMFWV
jgi:hypothetical protein